MKINCCSQNSIESTKNKSKYLRYLFYPDSNTNASLINLNYQYLHIPNSVMFKAGGMHLNIGLNLARFFTKKIILGICYDFKGFSGFTKQTLSNNFVNDFNSNFIPTYSNEKDSLRGYSLKGIINNDHDIRGNYFTNFGITFSPFPNKYGAIMIQIKKGNRTFKFSNDEFKRISTTDDYFVYLHLKNNYSIELNCKPYKFFNKKRTKLSEQKIQYIYKFIIIGIYIERITLKNATFNDVSLNQIVKQPFIDKYDKISNFGIKLGLGLY